MGEKIYEEGLWLLAGLTVYGICLYDLKRYEKAVVCLEKARAFSETYG
jgi:tetratricopeptide (TPR) repeat protein